MTPTARIGRSETGSRPATVDRILPILLVAAVVVAYVSSFAGSFVLDDKRSIVNNTRIRALWPPNQVLSGRRPVVDVTLAINYAVAGLNPVALHAVNLLIHLLAALTLMGLVRRTLARSPFADDSLHRSVPHPFLWKGCGTGCARVRRTSPISVSAASR